MNRKLAVLLVLLLAKLVPAETPSAILISPAGATVRSGSSLQFSATCQYANGSSDNCAAAGGVIWSASSPSQMSVSGSGLMTWNTPPVSGGLVGIGYVVARAGTAAGRAGVLAQNPADTWYQYPTPDYHTLQSPDGTINPLNVSVGATVTIGSGIVINNDASGGQTTGQPANIGCSWSSSNPSVFSVDQHGQATANAPGTATITCNRAGSAVFGSSKLGGWQSPGNTVVLTAVQGGSGSATWYVRPDGGTIYTALNSAGQCDGKHDAAYPGRGTNQPCAVSNVRHLWADGTQGHPEGWIIAGGDTILVRKNTLSGVDQGYNMNLDGPSPYQNNAPSGSGFAPAQCNGDPYCTMPPVPSGSPSQHTRILGENFSSCHTDAAKTLLNVSYNGRAAFNLKDSQFVDVACFEISDKAACTIDGNYTNACGGGPANFGMNGIVQSALTASVSLTDVFIHGLAGEAINGATGVGVSYDYLHIKGIPFAGVDMDDAPWISSNISQAGGLTMTNSITEFVGCVEEYPVKHSYPYIECRDQNTGAYGDGLGTGSTTGAWVFDHDIWRYNFQDGLDLLHSGMQSLVVTNSQSYANDGQNYKIGSADAVTFRNNVSLSNCFRILETVGDEPASAIVPGVAGCRAAGDHMVLKFSDLGSYYVQNNTLAGYGSVMWDMSCDAGWDSCKNATAVYQNNISRSYRYANYNDNQQAAIFYQGSAPSAMPPLTGWSVRDHNLFFSARTNGNPCSSGPGAGELCSNPDFVTSVPETITDSTQLDGFNFNLTAASPARSAGITIANLVTDLLGNLRGSSPSIGAYQYVSGAASAPVTTPTPPVTTPTPPVTTPTTPVSTPTPPVTTPTAPTTPIQTKQSTTLTLSASPATTVVGQTVTLKVSATAAAGMVPSGPVTFTINGSTITTALNANGNALTTVSSLPANTYTATAAYAGDSNFAAAASVSTSVTITPAPVARPVSVTIGQPTYGFNLIPGSVRRIYGTVTNGVTNQLTWSLKSGSATLSSTTGSWVDVKAPQVGGTCTNIGLPSAPIISSSVEFILQATSVDDPSKNAEILVNVCNPQSNVSVVPGYRTLYANQAADLQSLVVGSTNDSVNWNISSAPEGGDGKLVDTTSRDTVFSATVPGRYLITATSAADTSKVATTIMYVTGNAMPYRVTRSHTEPVDCSVDPALVGPTYEVGPSQVFKRLQDVPLTSLVAGSTIRVHNEDPTGNAPTVYNEYLQLGQNATSDQPIRICGVPDTYGNLPILDGTNATGRPDTASGVAGKSLLTIGGTQTTTSWPNFSGAQSISVEGLHLRNARPDLSYVAPGGNSAAWTASASCLLIREGHDINVAGVEMEGCGIGGASLWNGNSWNSSSLNHLWEGNYVHANAAPGAATNHQLYLQGWGQVVQFNRIDGIAAGSPGANLKSRGIQDVIRYNYFGDGAARDLDLVEVQSAAAFMSFADFFTKAPSGYTMDQLAAWQEAWNSHFVYGNIYLNSTSAAPMHFAYDTNAGEPARKGNLFWYNNTFSQPECIACAGQPLTLFDQSGANGAYLPQTEFPTFQIFNNAIWVDTTQFNFQWNDFSAFIGVGGSNVLPANWGANTLSGGLGDGWNNTANAAAYQNASSLALHITGFASSSIATTSNLPFDRVSWILSTFKSGSADLPDDVCAMPTRFAFLPTLGYAVARTATPNVGATDTTTQTAAILNLGTGSRRTNTRYSTCR